MLELAIFVLNNRARKEVNWLNDTGIYWELTPGRLVSQAHKSLVLRNEQVNIVPSRIAELSEISARSSMKPYPCKTWSLRYSEVGVASTLSSKFWSLDYSSLL